MRRISERPLGIDAAKVTPVSSPGQTAARRGRVIREGSACGSDYVLRVSETGIEIHIGPPGGRTDSQTVQGVHRKERPSRARRLTALSAIEHHELVLHGVEARTVKDLAGVLELRYERVVEALGLAVATINRKRARDLVLSPSESDPVVGLARLMSLVQSWPVSDAAALEGFRTGAWLGAWLAAPNPALGDRLPLDLLKTSVGRNVVERLLGSIPSGAYW